MPTYAGGLLIESRLANLCSCISDGGESRRIFPRNIAFHCTFSWFHHLISSSDSYESRELIARLKSIIKRSQPDELKEKILSISDLILNTERKILTRGNKRIPLTVKEYELLEYLLQNKGKIVSKSEIAENIWQTKIYSNTNVIEVYINFLRKKIDKNFSTKLIRTHVGIGYELKEESTPWKITWEAHHGDYFQYKQYCLWNCSKMPV